MVSGSDDDTGLDGTRRSRFFGVQCGNLLEVVNKRKFLVKFNINLKIKF